MNNANIHIHTFAYNGDAYIIRETVMCARQALPDARMVVIEEESKPFAPEVRQEIVELGAEHRISTWPRRGNLRGKDCIIGILTEMLSSALSDNDLLIKLDADTCIINGDEIRAFAEDRNKIMCACGAMHDRIHGFCYCIRASAVKKAIDYLHACDIPDHAPEDILIGLAIYKLFPDESAHTIHSPVKPGATWRAFHWWDYPDARKYRQASVITTGNPPPAPMTRKQRPVMMRYLRTEATSRIRSEELQKRQ